MTTNPPSPDLDPEELREAIRCEYREVARTPDRGFHFHTGRALARIVEYEDAWLEGIPAAAVDRFAGTGNPFREGPLSPGERVLDLGCGAGIDSFLAARQVGPSGAVLGIDMTEEMVAQARAAQADRFPGLEFRTAYFEDLPVEDGWADVVISNGALNLTPDKPAVYREIHRVLRPGGRLRIADILVKKPVSEKAKARIDLWTG